MISQNLWNTFAAWGQPDWGILAKDIPFFAVLTGFVLAIVAVLVVGAILMLCFHASCVSGSGKFATWLDSEIGGKVTIIIVILVAILSIILPTIDGFNVRRHMHDTYTTETVSATGYKKLARGKYQFELPDQTKVTTKPQVKLIYTRDKIKNNKLQKARLVITHMKRGYKRPECWIPRVKKSVLYQYKYSTSKTGNSSDMQDFSN